MRVVAVVVLAIDAVLLAWTEMAWLTLRVGESGTPLPLSVLVAALTTPILVLAADAAIPGTRAAMVPVAAWTLTVVVAGVWSPAGAGVLPADWRALALLVAGVLPALIIAVRRPPRPATDGETDAPTDAPNAVADPDPAPAVREAD